MTTEAHEKIIVNSWQGSVADHRVNASHIIDRKLGCEGVDIYRYSAFPDALLEFDPDEGHIVSLLQGEAVVSVKSDSREFRITAGTHIYLPPAIAGNLQVVSESVLVHASAPGDRPHGSQLLVHNERFLAPTRFVLTPQYLSRRAFLNRDRTLVSRSGDAIAWFHTTMFDTRGLPSNSDGIPVFKMSYDNQSEINVIYDAQGESKVRFAKHPYVDPESQDWSEWHRLCSETTYYLNESADGDEIEYYFDSDTGRRSPLRNRHEIYIPPNGHVSLCCLFDPGPTGLETHKPGEYSSYAPVAETINSLSYKEFLESVSAADRMIHELSTELAIGGEKAAESAVAWAHYMTVLEAAIRAEELFMTDVPIERRPILEPWRIAHLDRQLQSRVGLE